MLRLITVRFSHFCEKARWALDRAGLPYVEESHVPILSWPFTYAARGRRTVPVLVTPERTLSDSTDILSWIDAQAGARGGAGALYPAGSVGADAASLEDDFDRRLGPDARRIAYWYLLPSRERSTQILASAGSPLQARITQLLFPALRAIMVRGLKIEAGEVERSRARIAETFAAVEARLVDGRRYLCGDRFTAADLTFASLSVPVILPDYNRRFLPSGMEPPAELATLRDELRATVAGRFALRLYAEEREPRSAKAVAA